MQASFPAPREVDRVLYVPEDEAYICEDCVSGPSRGR